VSAARHEVPVLSNPPGAGVYYKDYDEPDSEWIHLGNTPLQKISIPRGLLRWKFELEGFRTVVSAMPSVIPGAPISPLNFTLEPADEAIDGMVYVQPGLASLPFNGFDPLDFIPV